METLDIWKDVHPSLVTIPVEWEYTMPYGIVYAQNPPRAAQNFIQMIQGYADNKKREKSVDRLCFSKRKIRRFAPEWPHAPGSARGSNGDARNWKHQQRKV